MHTHSDTYNLEPTKSWYQTLFILMAVGLLYYSLGSYLRPFSAPDQLDYIFDFYSPLLQLSHSLFTPNDYSSPTLYYSLLKFIHHFTNQHLWFYRLPNSLLFLATAFATGVVARHYWEPLTGIIATTVMITFVGSYIGSQSIAPQMFAASITTLGLLCFFMSLQSSTQKKCYLWWGYGFLAFSYMAGGLFALLSPLLIALGMLAFSQKKWQWHFLRHHGGILLILFTLLVWHKLAPNPQGDWIQGWTPLLNTFKQTTYTPGWAFLLHFIIIFLPFGFFIMNSLWFSKNALWQMHGATSQHRLLLQLWIIVPLILCILCKPNTTLWLTISASPMALCLAPYFHCIWHEKNVPNFHIPTQLLLGISFFIIITLGLIAFYKQFVSISPTYRESIQIITTLLIIITLMGIAGLYKRTFAIYFSGLTLLTLVYTIGLTLIYADLHNTPLYFHLPSKLGNSVQKQEPLAHEKQSTPIQYCPQITSALHG
ncbi:MAG: ArnT family glycosyltransferase [Gammaproteobacteria bacterium]